MPNVWVIRSDYGKYTGHFVDGAYVAAGWLRGNDLSQVKTKDEIRAMYRQAHPEQSTQVVGANAGQLWLFLNMAAGDYVMTPCSDSQWLYHGRVIDYPYRYAPNDPDGCIFPHRRPVAWKRRRVHRSEFSEKAQNTLKYTAKTAFPFKHNDEFLEIAGQDAVPPKYPYGEVRARGEKIYEAGIKSRVEPHECGKFIVIDIESGDFEVDANILVASRRIRERRPDSTLYRVKVGLGAAFRMGWRSVRRQ